MQTSDNGSAVEARLRVALANGDEEELLRAIAGAEIVLPQDAREEGRDGIDLPVIEQDGLQFVPVFTSERVMHAAAPEVTDAVSVLASELAAVWPEDQLWMVVNPGTLDGVSLPPDVVRMLPLYAD